jgi:hypothetical protein
VGEDLAAVSAPERIRWPRGAGEAQQMQGGTLVVRAAPGRALELQYEALRIIARINGYLGYGAIAKLKAPLHDMIAVITRPKAKAIYVK